MAKEPKPSGIVDIRGKQYQTVAYRVGLFRAAHPEHSLTTQVLVRDDECVVICATIADPTGRVIANGHSEEYRSATQINKTSALENAETSAIGRALAAFGLGGTEFASANEVQNAIHQQNTPQGSPANARVNWGGRYPTGTALKKAMHEHHAELERIGNEGVFDDLDTYLQSPEYQDYVRIAGEHRPFYLEGELPEETPPEFVQAFTLEQRARDMIAIRGNNPMENTNEQT